MGTPSPEEVMIPGEGLKLLQLVEVGVKEHSPEEVMIPGEGLKLADLVRSGLAMCVPKRS